ncbi:MAG: hypothetical protein OXI79_14585 [Gammaproteobacteria bacterium]|nr:hypothetical protein [Gammaproteobacteria bacterium]
MAEPQFADEAVSRTKFDREVAAFRAQAAAYRRRGWYLVHAEFPEAMVLLATPNTQPMAILCGVAFDYTNYDAAPPSVRLVNPMTSEPYKGSELPTQLPKRVPANDTPVVVKEGLPPQVQFEVLAGQPLMQAHKPDDIPFLCIAGVREYHEHPAHSGDHWELYRSSGAGSLTRLVGIVSKYGLEPIAGFNVQMIPQVSFNVGPPPE